MMLTHDEMKNALANVKERYGVYYAKALIESFGVRKLMDVLPGHWSAAHDTAKAMTDANDDRRALELLVNHIAKFVDHWFRADHSSINIVFREWESYGNAVPSLNATPSEPVKDMTVDEFKALTMHPAMLPKLSPNDIIATLLEIAFTAERMLGTGLTDGETVSVRVKQYRDLFDALAPLQQLPFNIAQGDKDSGPLRAKYALDSFLTGASVTIAGKEALEGIMAAMDAAVPGFLEAGGVVGPATNDGWVIAKETVVEMPDGKKELGYTFISGLGVFTDEHDASKSLNELELPLGYVIMRVTQLLPGFIMPLLDDAVGLEKPVNEVFAVRNFDDAYVEQLSVAVADLASDGKRFRTLIWMVLQGMAQDQRADAVLTGGEPVPMGEKELKDYLNLIRANEIMSEADPQTLEQFRAALDDVYRAGLLPDMDAKAVDTAHAHDVLRTDAITLSRAVLDTYVSFTHPICKYCGGSVPGDTTDTLDEQHKATCPVTLARQLIENES